MLKILKFVPLQLVFFLVVGIIISSYLSPSLKLLFGFLFGLVILFISIFFWVNKQSKNVFLFNLITYSIAIVVGMISFSSQTELNHKRHYSNLNFQQDSIQEFSIIITKKLKANQYNYRYEANLKQLNWIETKGKILLNIKKDTTQNELNIDDNLFVKTILEDIRSPKNPGEFNYKKYLKNQQIYHQIRISNNDFIKIQNPKKSIKGYAYQTREKINYSLINSGFKANELAVINALLLGQRQTIDDDLLENYVNAGAIHILAVSGLHIGIILVILQFLLKPLKTLSNGKFTIITVSLIMLWLYAILAGLSPSVVRAVTMFSALAIGMSLNKPSNTYNSLFISMFILLLIHPFYIFEVGFQLSYLAVFFIVWLQPKISSLWKPKYKFINYFWQLFAVSLAAQFGVGLLSIYYFHQFPGLFFISNLVIIPVLGLILIFGIVVIILSLLSILPNIVAESYMFIIQKMNAFVSFIGEQESFLAENISISLTLLIVFYTAIIAFVIWIQSKEFKSLVVFLSIVIIIFTINIYDKYIIETSNEFIIFHKNTESLIGIKKGSSALFNADEEVCFDDYNLKNYLLAERVNDFEFAIEKQYLFNFEETQILVIDEKSLYRFTNIKPSVIILQNSPKLNIDRVIKFYEPKLLIADGSNYKSFVERWCKSCLETKTPFYNTLQKGAYILKD